MWQAYRSKKYLLRIIGSLTLLIVAVLAGSSLLLQYNAERSAIRMQQEVSHKAMKQIQINLSYMSGVMNNLAVSLYMDPNIVPLLNLRDPDEMLVIRSMNTLKQAYLSSSFLHSILVYNGYDDRTYTVGELSLNKPDAPMTGEIALLVKNKQKLPRMKLIPMNFSGTDQPVDFFSLVMYQNFTDTGTGREGALVVNIKPEWLYETLRSFNDFVIPEQSGVYLLDEAGNVLLSGNPELLPQQTELTRALAGHTPGDAESSGTLSGKFGGSTRLLVNYLNMQGTDWKVVSVQPYDIILKPIRELRGTFLSVIIAVLLLAVALATLVAHKLYEPIGRLIRQLGMQTAGTAAGKATGQDKAKVNVKDKDKDELSAVASLFSTMAQQLRSVSDEQGKQRHIITSYYLRTLLSGGKRLSAKEFEDNIRQNGLQISRNGPYRVVLIQVDGYSGFISRTSHNERSLYYFAIRNIAEEILRPGHYLCELADMRSSHLALLISRAEGSNSETEDEEALHELFRNLQQVVSGYYQLSLTLTASEPCGSHEQIPDRYAAAVQYSMYKLVFGRQSIITKERVDGNLRQLEYRFPAELEKRLGESIRTGNLPAMEQVIGHMLAPLGHCHYDVIVHSLLHIAGIIKTSVKEINHNRVVPLNVELSTLSRQVLEQETLQETAELFGRVCRDIHDQLDQTGSGKNAALMDAIKEIIEMNYKEPNLSLQGIASMLHMTPAYIGRMFKQSEDVSVSEYLNDIRLQHAQTYLETKNFSIKQIMELVGYVNESTFFKLFKKAFGVTPKEYRLKRSLE